MKTLVTKSLSLLVAGALSVSPLRVLATDNGEPDTPIFTHDVMDPCWELRESAMGAPDTLVLEVDGREVLGFDSAVAKLMLCESKVLRLQRRELSIFQDSESLLKLRIRLLEGQVKLSNDARVEFQSVVEASEKRALIAEEKLERWYRHPAFLIGVGVVLTSVAGFAIVIVTK